MKKVFRPQHAAQSDRLYCLIKSTVCSDWYWWHVTPPPSPVLLTTAKCSHTLDIADQCGASRDLVHSSAPSEPIHTYVLTFQISASVPSISISTNHSLYLKFQYWHPVAVCISTCPIIPLAIRNRRGTQTAQFNRHTLHEYLGCQSKSFCIDECGH